MCNISMSDAEDHMNHNLVRISKIIHAYYTYYIILFHDIPIVIASPNRPWLNLIPLYPQVIGSKNLCSFITSPYFVTSSWWNLWVWAPAQPAQWGPSAKEYHRALGLGLGTIGISEPILRDVGSWAAKLGGCGLCAHVYPTNYLSIYQSINHILDWCIFRTHIFQLASLNP